jgi:hypothetical protein
MPRFDATVKRFDVTTNHIASDVAGAESRSVERVGGEVPLLPANHIRQNAHLYLAPTDRARSLTCPQSALSSTYCDRCSVRQQVRARIFIKVIDKPLLRR